MGYVKVTFKQSEKDMEEYLSSKSSKTAYIKELIKNDMEGINSLENKEDIQKYIQEAVRKEVESLNKDSVKEKIGIRKNFDMGDL